MNFVGVLHTHVEGHFSKSAIRFIAPPPVGVVDKLTIRHIVYVNSAGKMMIIFVIIVNVGLALMSTIIMSLGVVLYRRPRYAVRSQYIFAPDVSGFGI